MQKKLYGCRTCNKIGYKDVCCVGGTYELNIDKSLTNIKDHDISSNDIFNMHDSKIRNLTQEISQLCIKNMNLAKRVNILEETMETLQDRLGKLYADNQPANKTELNESSYSHISKMPYRGPEWDNSLKEKYDKLFKYVSHLASKGYNTAKELLQEIGEHNERS
jgi:hypothetical protein